MPFLTGFGKRKEIRYGTVFPGANLTDFPKLFKISGDSDIAAELASGGGIAVTGSDGTTTVPFGVYPSSNLASGDLILRAKFSPLTAASTGDVLGYLYYDSTGATTQNKSGVVSNGYARFMPLEEDPSGSAPQIRDWVTDSLIGTSNGSMASGDLVTGQVGKGLEFDRTANQSVDIGTLTLNDFTFECILKLGVTGQFQGLLSRTSASGFFCYIDTNQKPYFYCGGTDFAGTSAISATSFVHLAFNRSGTAGTIYHNGAANGTNANVGSNVGPYSFNLGGGKSSTEDFSGVLDEARISSVARSADWIAYAYADDFNNANTFSLGVEEVDGGGGVTLAADSGSFTLSGQAALLKASRKLTAESGSYVLTGQAASLLVGRKISVDAGTLTVTGTAATLKVDRRLSAASGSYALTGQDAALNVGGDKTLSAESGSFALTGQDATLRLSRVISAVLGEYSFTGQPATLRVARRLTCASGTFVLTGMAAGIEAGEEEVVYDYGCPAQNYGGNQAMGVSVIPQSIGKQYMSVRTCDE